MNTHAYIFENTVVEILRPVDGFTLTQCFPPDIVAACRPCGNEVQPGWLFDGESFTPPPTLEPEAPTRLDRIRAIQADYKPQLDALLAALASAQALDDGEDATDIKAEYSSLIEEMTAEIHAVQNEED